MKIDINTLKNLIKEELHKALKEELYLDQKKEEEAIEYMMKTYGFSREEAEEAIKETGEEMMGSETFRDSVQQDKENLRALNKFKNLAAKYKEEAEKGKYAEKSMEFERAKFYLTSAFKKSEANNIEDFLIQEADEIIAENDPDVADLILGYNACMNNVDEELAKLLDIEGKYEDEMEKNMFFRDLGVLWKRAKASPEIEEKLKNREKECKKDLTYAYYYSISSEQIRREEHDSLISFIMDRMDVSTKEEAEKYGSNPCVRILKKENENENL